MHCLPIMRTLPRFAHVLHDLYKITCFAYYFSKNHQENMYSNYRKKQLYLNWQRITFNISVTSCIGLLELIFKGAFVSNRSASKSILWRICKDLTLIKFSMSTSLFVFLLDIQHNNWCMAWSIYMTYNCYEQNK